MLIKNNTIKTPFQDIQKYELTLTSEAAKQIKKLIFDNIGMIGLRVNIKKSGCAGFSYIFDKVMKENLDHTDLIFEHYGAKLFVPFKTIPLINGSRLDYVKEELSYAFKFKNPKARHLCGCGESFSI